MQAKRRPKLPDVDAGPQPTRRIPAQTGACGDRRVNDRGTSVALTGWTIGFPQSTEESRPSVGALLRAVLSADRRTNQA